MPIFPIVMDTTMISQPTGVQLLNGWHLPTLGISVTSHQKSLSMSTLDTVYWFTFWSTRVHVLESANKWTNESLKECLSRPVELIDQLWGVGHYVNIKPCLYLWL